MAAADPVALSADGQAVTLSAPYIYPRSPLYLPTSPYISRVSRLGEVLHADGGASQRVVHGHDELVVVEHRLGLGVGVGVGVGLGVELGLGLGLGVGVRVSPGA